MASVSGSSVAPPTLRWWWGVALLTAAALYVVQRVWPTPILAPGAMVDDSIYLELAAALQRGEYAIRGMLPTPLPGVHFPPLYPAFLLAVRTVGTWLGFPAWSPVWLLTIQQGVALCSVAAWVLVAERWTRPVRVPAMAGAVDVGREFLALALAGGGGLLVHALPISRILSGTLLSEPVAAAWLALTVLWLERQSDHPIPSRGPVLLALFLLGLTLWWRSAWLPMVTVLLAGYAWQLLRREGGAAVLVGLAVGLVPFGVWGVWWVVQAPHVPDAVGSSYTNYAQFLGEGLAHPAGLRGLLALQTGQLARLGGGLFGVWPIAVMVGGVMLWGASRVRLPGHAVALGLIGLVAMVWVWPFYPDRFLLAFGPLAVVCLVVGLLQLAQMRLTVLPGPWPGRIAVAVVALGLRVPLVRHTLRGSRDGSLSVAIQGQFGDALPAVQWMETAPDSLAPFYSHVDHLVRWYAKKPSVPIPPFRGDWYLREPRTPEIADALAATVCVHPRGTAVFSPSDSTWQRAVAYLGRLKRGRVQVDSLQHVAPGVAIQRITCRPVSAGAVAAPRPNGSAAGAAPRTPRPSRRIREDVARPEGR